MATWVFFMSQSQAKPHCHAAAIFFGVLPCASLSCFGMAHQSTARRCGLRGANRLAMGLLQLSVTMFVLLAQMLWVGVWKVLHLFAVLLHPALDLRGAGW